MTRYETGAVWRRVNRSRRCWVCGKPDWCLLSDDGMAAICPRISEGSVKDLGEAGYLHVKGDRQTVDVRKYHRRVPSLNVEPVSPTITAMWLRQVRALSERRLAAEADSLGVRAMSLLMLEAGWCKEWNCMSFPMRDGDGNFCGIRYRTSRGRKFAEKGSRSGLFMPTYAEDEIRDAVFICEGPTDTAAVLSLPLNAIGRPSCRGGVEHVMQFADRVPRGVRWVILSDRDGPGWEGACVLQKAMRNEAHDAVVMVPPWGKDVREWSGTMLPDRKAAALCLTAYGKQRAG